MAVYKVPQDVEAEDKLVAWLSFRQFIYAMIAGGAAFVGFFLFQISPVLVAIPLPIFLIFGTLVLPLRKDQPLETYLLAVIRFIFKPKKRLWNPDGVINYVEITVPRKIERQLTKNLAPQTAEERFDYLARVMDSRGWSMKGVDKPAANLTTNAATEAAGATDIMDDKAELAKSFDNLIAKKQQESRQAAVDKMKQSATAPATPPRPHGANNAGLIDSDQPQYSTAANPGLHFANNPYDVLERQFTDEKGEGKTPHFNPYPTIHQKVIQPNDNAHKYGGQPAPNEPADNNPPSTVPPAVSPDIMRLAGNKDLSISAIAHEAHRLEEGDEGEVVIKLH